jgi:uncharacterized membrane protein YfcA
MAMDTETLAVLAVLFASTFIRATFGFGDALLAMPLLTMLIGLRAATPLVALVAGVIAVSILVKHWRDVQFRSAWRLVLASALGIPVGLLFLKGVHESATTLVLGVGLLAYAVYGLLRPRAVALGSERAAFPFGFVAGILGGAYNVNGPAVVIYGTLRRWPPATFRATLQGYFLLTNVLIMAGHCAAGLWTRPVLGLFLRALPVVVVAVLVGERLHRAISPGRFERAILVLLAVVAALLLARTVPGVLP